MKKTLFIALLAAVVATSCSSSDDPKPVVDPIKEDFSAATTGTLNITNWTVVKEQGTLDWSVSKYGPNKYAEITTYKQPTGNYATWLVSPALDVENAANKTVSFDVAYNYWKDGNKLEVYALTDPDPTKGTKTLLQVTIPTGVVSATGPNYAYEVWYNTGSVDLSQFKSKIYIGIKYTGSETATTTYRFDNFKFNAEPAEGEVSDKAIAIDKASLAASQDSSIKWVTGYVVGFANTSKTADFELIKANFTSAQNTNIVIAAKADETDISKCMAVALPNKSSLRDEINLYTNSSKVLGKQIIVRGVLTKYFGTHPGIKSTSAYVLK